MGKILLCLDVFGERFTEALPVEEIEGWFFSASAPSIAFALAIKTMYFIVDNFDLSMAIGFISTIAIFSLSYVLSVGLFKRKYC